MNNPRHTLLTDAHIERNKLMMGKRVLHERRSKEQPRTGAAAMDQYDAIKRGSKRDRE